MSIPVTCRSCQSQFNAPDDSVGKRTKCPKCGGIIEIQAPAPPEVVYEAEEAPYAPFNDADFEVEKPAAATATDEGRKPCPMCGEMIAAKAIQCRFCGELLDKSMKGVVRTAGDIHDPGWKKVHGGLNTLYYSIVIIFATVVVLMITGMALGFMGAAAGPGRGGAGLPAAMGIVFVIGGLVMLGAGIGALVGQIRCANVPESSGARGYATGSAICVVGYIVLSFVGGAIQNPAITGCGSLLSAIGSILFILFIRASASYLGEPQLASSAGRFIIFSVLVVVGAFALGILSAVAGAPMILGILGLAAIVCGLVAIIWYLRLIRSLWTAIDQRIGA